jgi:hypothetical protein
MHTHHGHGPPRGGGILSKFSVRKRYLFILAVIAVVYVVYNFVFFDTILNRNSDPLKPKDLTPVQKTAPQVVPHNDWGQSAKNKVDNSLSQEGTNIVTQTN